MAEYSVPSTAAGLRLDHWLTQTIPGPSRTRWQALVREGDVRVDGKTAKPSYELRGNELVEYRIPAAEPLSLVAEDIPLDILFEDGDLLAVNKPPGLVVHPAPGHATGTLVHALLHHCRDIRGIGGGLRPGIVHRIDKDTSGILVVAKHDESLQSMQRQFTRRTIRKEYEAVVHGTPNPPRGTVDTLIGRHPVNRKKMSTSSNRGKPAVSHYQLKTPLRNSSMVHVQIETGRTHQIRLHMSHIGNPVIGDALYGGRRDIGTVRAPRQMLHASQIELDHPMTGRSLSFVAPLPDDMAAVIRQLG